MNMKIFAFFLLVLIPTFSQGSQLLPEQRILELEKTKDRNEKIRILEEIVKITYKTNSDTSLYFAKMQKDLAKITGNRESYVRAIWSIAGIYKRKGVLKNAATFLFEAYNEYTLLNNEKMKSVALYNIGQVFMAGNDFSNALLYLQRALDGYVDLNDSQRQAYASYEMARSYLALGKYEKSLYHLNQCLSNNEHDQSLPSKAHNYLGATYFKMKDYNKAIEEYFSSIKAAQGLEDFKKKSAIAYNNIGESYLYAEDLENAEVYLLKALTLKKELGDPNFTLSTQVLLSRLATKKQEYEEALNYLQEGIIMADKSVINANLMDALDEVLALNERQSIVHIPADQIISYFKFENQQARLLRGLNDELGSLNSRYVLKNAFETYQLSEANDSLTDQLSQSKVIIILTVLLSLFTGILSVYYVRKYLVLKEFKQETTLGLELISHQLERTIKMASKK